METVKETATAMDDEHSIPDMVDLTIARIRRGLESREFTCADLCEVSLSSFPESGRLFPNPRAHPQPGLSGENCRSQPQAACRHPDESRRHGHRSRP